MTIDSDKIPMPCLFLGHGNPMNAIERNSFHLSWEDLAQQIPTPESILCISAHWETDGVWVTSTDKPSTIHDFFGFPQALFDVQYPAPGDPALAQHVVDLLKDVEAQLDEKRGLDHGTWSVLKAMYPKANIPVVQLSIDTHKPGSYHYQLAKKLAPLRHQGVLVLASGNMVHNLRLFSFRDQTPADWALEADEFMVTNVLANNHETLINYDRMGPHAQLAIPTPEHYIPLLYCLALIESKDSKQILNRQVHSSLSMTSIIVGLTQP